MLYEFPRDHTNRSYNFYPTILKYYNTNVQQQKHGFNLIHLHGLNIEVKQHVFYIILDIQDPFKLQELWL